MSTETEDWDDDLLAGLAFTQEEMSTVIKDREDRGRRDRDSRICMCGHTMHAHKVMDGLPNPVCRAGKVICNCTEPEPVLKPEDARLFLRATEGARDKHALSVGVARLAEKGLRGKWLVKRACVVCATEVGVFPVPFDKEGHVISGRSGTHNKFMCDAHYEASIELGGVKAVFQRYNSLGY